MRPTRMRTLGAALTAATLGFGLAACGSGTEPGQQPGTTSAPDASLFGDCRADDPTFDTADVVAEADIDGVAAKNEIAYVPADAGGPCANALFTTFEGDPSAVSLGETVLDPDSVEVIALKGSDRQLLLTRGEAHPRGGFSVHLYGGVDGRIGEVLAGGEPLVGFVATDGGAAPATATCTTDGGLATLTGATSEPPGVILAWDVWRTTYALDGNTAEVSSKKQVADHQADPLLRDEMPELFDPEALFTDCIVR